jgi:hypothetical protein
MLAAYRHDAGTTDSELDSIVTEGEIKKDKLIQRAKISVQMPDSMKRGPTNSGYFGQQ